MLQHFWGYELRIQLMNSDIEQKVWPYGMERTGSYVQTSQATKTCTNFQRTLWHVCSEIDGPRTEMCCTQRMTEHVHGCDVLR